MMRRRKDDVRLLGEIAADLIARRLGSWNFVVAQSLLLAVWIAWNGWLPAGWRFDPPPFIGLNLLLSFEAAFTAPILLISANRTAAEDRAKAAADRHTMHEILRLLKAREGAHV